MNKKGFTLVELIATIAILGIVVSVAIYAANGGFSEAKNKTEDVFIKTIEDALSIYTNSDATKLKFATTKTCTIAKRFGNSNIYKNTTSSSVTLQKVIDSEYTPLEASDLVNPANQKTCKLNVAVNIYRDDDYVYYYRLKKSSLNCLNDTTGYITNLPSGCAG